MLSSVPMCPCFVSQAERTPTDRDGVAVVSCLVFSKSRLHGTVGPSLPEQLFAMGYLMFSLVGTESRLVVHVVYQCMR